MLIETKGPKLRVLNLFSSYLVNSQVNLLKLFLQILIQIKQGDRLSSKHSQNKSRNSKKRESVCLGLCNFCISLLFIQPKVSLTLLGNLTSTWHL